MRRGRWIWLVVMVAALTMIAAACGGGDDDEPSAGDTGASEPASDDLLAKIKADGELKLVISDVNMPNMDGLTMAEKVRSDLKNAAVNIIMLTTENSPAMKDRGKAAGIKGWIVKPFNGDAIVGAIGKLVS